MTQPLGAAALPRFLARSAAGSAAGCAAVHGLALVAAPHPGAAGTAALAAACLLCAGHLWRRPGRAAWAAHVVLPTAMLAAHPPVVAHHAATGPVVWAGPVAGLLAFVALLLAALRGCDGVRRSGSCGPWWAATGHEAASKSDDPRLVLRSDLHDVRDGRLR